MGGDIELVNSRLLAGEPVADIRVRSSRFAGIEVDPALVSLAIDEFPVLFVAAGCASGKTTFSGIGELRVKESDRIAAMASGLRELGIRVEESDDGAVVYGGPFGGGTVQSFGDHRIAMSLAVAGTIADAPVTVRDPGGSSGVQAESAVTRVDQHEIVAGPVHLVEFDGHAGAGRCRAFRASAAR